MIPLPTQVEIARFKSNLITRDNGCIEWTGYKMKNGYGQLRYQQRTVYAHRFAYYLDYPEHDQSLCILHKCDNPSCCNTLHHFLGTRIDNGIDRDTKGRTARGVAVGGWLREKDIEEIFSLKKEGKTQASIARRFKVAQSQISRIINGHRWGHMTNKVGIKDASSIDATPSQGHDLQTATIPQGHVNDC